MIVRIGPAGLAGILILAWAGACNPQHDAGASPAPVAVGPDPVVSQAGASAEETGLTVGSTAPKFTLKDQSSEQRSLDEFLGQGKKVALVFYRSADW